MDIPRPPKRTNRRYLFGALGFIGIVAVTVALSRLDPAVPTVDRAAVWTDTVRRGTMLVQVRAPGTLVPEALRHVSALTAGRIERRLVDPGTPVDAETVLLEMSNPDVQLEALESERQLSAAEAALVSLRTTLETQRLTQDGVVATIRTQRNDAVRNARALESLAASGGTTEMDLAAARDLATELEARFEIEQRRLRVLRESMGAQLARQQSQVDRLSAIADFQRARVGSMTVRAGTHGVVQDVPLEEGQWVTPGTTLARVVRPDRLKAELRVPEVQARDVAPGQPVLIDTRRDTVLGHVARIDPGVQNGAVCRARVAHRRTATRESVTDARRRLERPMVSSRAGARFPRCAPAR